MLEVADLGIAAPALAQNYSFQGNVVCPSGKKIFAEAVLALVLARVENCMKNK